MPIKKDAYIRAVEATAPLSPETALPSLGRPDVEFMFTVPVPRSYSRGHLKVELLPDKSYIISSKGTEVLIYDDSTGCFEEVWGHSFQDSTYALIFCNSLRPYVEVYKEG